MPSKSTEGQEPNGNGGPDFSFLETEYAYVTQSSFHTDKLRDRYIEFYILLTGAAFSGILGLAQSGKVAISPYVLGLISLFLAIVGVFEVLIFVRLRRVVIESLQASTLIKTYYIKHYSHLEPAFLWGTKTVPQRERLYTASFLLVLLVIFLDSAMFATSAYFFLETRLGLVWLSWRLAVSVFVFGFALLLQAWLYLWRINKELMRTGYKQKLEQLRSSDSDPAE